MRRRRREQTVNLFAFQDIITGVAGVMLFILLLLVVQLSLRLATQAAELQEAQAERDARQISAVSEPVDDPAANLESLQADLDQLRRDNQDLIDASSRNLNQEIQQAQVELADIVRDADAAKAQAESLQKQIASQEISSERKEILVRRQRLREQLEALKQEELRHGSGKLVAFKMTANQSRQTWVIDLTDSRAVLFDVQQPMDVTTVEYDRTQLPVTTVEQIETVLATKTKIRSIILVLRPSVAGVGAVFLSEFRDAGFSLALELLDEDTLITESGDVQVAPSREGGQR